MTRGRWKARTIGACLLAALGGCQAMQDSRREVDPLLGGVPLPAESGSALPYIGRPSVASDVPPLQTGRTSTSPAALAIGPGSADDDRRAPAVLIAAPRPPGQPPGVVVPASAGGGPVTAMTPGGGTSYEQIQQALKARGVVWQQLDMTGKPDEWHFICAIPNPNVPNLRRNHEATMVGPFGLNAMRAALEQIDQQR